MSTYVRFRSEFYGTMEPIYEWQVDIIDTATESGSLTTFAIYADPSIRFSGLPQDLKPGIYTTNASIEMEIRNSTHEALIDDIVTSEEGRFLIRIYRNAVHYFTGIIIADQCHYEDMAKPYSFHIEAVCGLHRLQTKDYVSKVGFINYLTCVNNDPDGIAASSTPLVDCLTGTEWTLIEHLSSWADFLGGTLTSSAYGRFEQYAAASPGTGWVDQGEGLWAKAIPYTNEVEESNLPYEYRLTRDISEASAPYRTIAEYISEVMNVVGLADQYPDPDIMWDNVSEWYEHNMANFTDDPFSMTRIPEKQFIGMNYDQVMQEICRLMFMRVFYSAGRYHFEQISARADATVKRFTYTADGTYAGSETPTLDIDTDAEDVTPGTGGQFKFLAALSYVETKFKTDNNNLLEGLHWNLSRQGMRYLGRITKADGAQLLQLTTRLHASVIYRAAEMAALDPGLRNWMSLQYRFTTVHIRIKNTVTGVTHWLTPEEANPQEVGDLNGTWETADAAFEVYSTLGPYDIDQLSQSRNPVLRITSDVIPGAVGTPYDVYISITFRFEFLTPLGLQYWVVENPDAIQAFQNTNDPVMLSVKADGDEYDEVNANAERIYFIENNVNNTLKVKQTVLFGDVGIADKGINIYDGAAWIPSAEWSRGGIGTPVELLQLLTTEIMGLRVTHRRIYSVQWLSVLPDPDNRLIRWGSYFLPLSTTKNIDLDGFSGEFLEIQHEEPPEGGTIYTPVGPGIADPNLDGDSGDQDIYPAPLVLETNEELTPGTYTECDIVNTILAHISSGAVVRIQHPTDVTKHQNVTLTQAITPTGAGSILMKFVSQVFSDTFPDASLIIVEPQLPPDVPVGIGSYFYFFAESYYGNSVAAPSYDFSLLSGLGTTAVDKRVEIFRAGIRIYYKPGASTITPVSERMKYWEYDVDTDSFTFPIPLKNELLSIKAW